MTSWDRNDYNKWVKLGCPKNDNITILNCSFNQLTSLVGIENLINLTELYCSDNQLTNLESIKNLTNLTFLNCSDNQLTNLESIKNLTNLTFLNCSDNQLTNLENIKNLTNLTILYCGNNQLSSLVGIENLTNLTILYCGNNQLSSLVGIENLTNLMDLYCDNNQLGSLAGIENLTNLRRLYYGNNPIDHIPPNLLRRLDRIKNGQNIYADNQNVHNHSIQEFIRESIQNILKCKPTIENLNNLILNDNILTQNTKEILMEYLEDTSVHTVLNITFGELLLYVFNRIQINEHKDEIKRILNIEMHESICKCFTERISRLINCLNGFDELVNIKIAGSEQISQIISLTQNKLKKEGNYNVELHKKLIFSSLKELDYDNDIINEWVNYIE
jgi:Leucine-rich repeat (LRR) protein